MENNNQSSDKTYLTYTLFLKQYLKDKSIFFNDFKNMNALEFKQKYNLDKNELNLEVIQEYKTNHKEDYEREKEEYMKKQREKHEAQKKQQEIRKEEIIKMVIRQTDYNYDHAKQLLKDNDYNYIDLIRDYVSNKNYKDRLQENINMENKKSINQKIYQEIRNFMDNSDDNVRI